MTVEATPELDFAVLMALDEAADSFLSSAAMTRKWKALDKALQQVQNRLELAFQLQGAHFLKLLTENKEVTELSEAEPARWEPLFDQAVADTFQVFHDPLASGLTESLALGTLQALGNFGGGISFQLDNPRAVDYLATQSARLVTGINETTRESLRSVFATSRVDGWSYDKLASALLQKYAHWSTPQPQQHIKSRAHLIAVNELAHAYEAGNKQVADHLSNHGLAMVKRWITGVPSGADALCKSNEAMGWIPMDQPFNKGAPHAPAHPACRCTTEYQRANKQCGCPAVGANTLLAEASFTNAQIAQHLGVSTGTLYKVKTYVETTWGKTPVSLLDWSDAYDVYKKKPTAISSGTSPLQTSSTPVAPVKPSPVPVLIDPKQAVDVLVSQGHTIPEAANLLNQASTIKKVYDVSGQPKYDAVSLIKTSQDFYAGKDIPGFTKPALSAVPKGVPNYDTPASMAKKLGIKPQKLYQMLKAGKIKQHDIGGKKYFEQHEVEAALKGGKKQAVGSSYINNQVKNVPCAKNAEGYVDHQYSDEAKKWGRQHWDRDLKNLNSNQKGALRDYQGNGYTRINGHLRGGSSATAETRVQIVQIDEAMTKYRMPENTIVHRGDGQGMLGGGLNADYTKYGTNVFDWNEVQTKIGKVFTDKGYMSTSIGSEAAFSSKTFQLKLKVPKGTGAIYMDQLDDIGEREVLLQRNLKYMVTDITKIPGTFGSPERFLVEATVIS